MKKIIIKLKQNLPLLLAIITSSWALNVSANATVGAGVSLSGTSEYKGYNSNSQYFPTINYEDDQFYFHVVSGGVFLFKADRSAFLLGLSYFPKEFDASDSTDNHMQKLNNRHSTGMVDIGYRYGDPVLGTVSATMSADVLDETHGGWKLDLGYKNSIPIFPMVMISPGFGVSWYNEDLTEHYYGVSSNEATRSTLNEYHPSSSISTYAELGINVVLTQSMSLFVNGRYVWLNDEITDSPMVGSSHSFGTMLGVNFIF